MSYATKTLFDGQKLSIGRVVLVRRLGGSVEPAIVCDVVPGDCAQAHSPRDGRAFTLSADTFSRRTAADVMDLPCGAWSWPPKV